MKLRKVSTKNIKKLDYSDINLRIKPVNSIGKLEGKSRLKSSPNKLYLRKILKLSMIIVLIVGLISAAGFIIKSTSATVLSFEKYSIKGVDSSDQKHLKIIIDENIDTNSVFDYENIEHIILKNAPNYKLVNIENSLRGKELVFEKRNYFCTIQHNTGKVDIDREGIIYKSTDNNDPKVIVNNNLSLGETVNEAVLSACYFDTVKKQIHVANNEIYIYLDNGIKIILPGNNLGGATEQTNDLLQKIVQKYTVNGNGIEFIDLRFSKPVIKYK